MKRKAIKGLLNLMLIAPESCVGNGLQRRFWAQGQILISKTSELKKTDELEFFNEVKTQTICELTERLKEN